MKLVILVTSLLLSCFIHLNASSDELRLTILHLNDFHAHIEQTNEHLTRCRPEQASTQKCFGGIARMFTKIKEIRDRNPKNTLLFHAGDFYQGTIWYSIFKYEPMVEFANLLNFTAMALGNHDFDDGNEGLIPFLSETNFPIVAANLHSTELNKHTKKSITIVVDGFKIGIIGYITPSTKNISKPGDSVSFSDEIFSVRDEALRLKSVENVSILIALGHSGYDYDVRMAQQISDLDLVIGGHSHTFLYSGNSLPSIEKPEGPYPTYVRNNSTGKMIPVVQAYYYSKYLGHLQLKFGPDGDLRQPVDGTGVQKAFPILLDGNVGQDESVVTAMEKYRHKMTAFTSSLGSSVTDLIRIDYVENKIANAITDSMLHGGWKDDVKIALINNGGIRSDLAAGDITGEDILHVLPFNNTIDKIVLNGSGILNILENSARRMCQNFTCHPGLFLHVTGLKIEYLVVQGNEGHRVLKIETTDCKSIQSWCPVINERNYSVALPSYLANGGGRHNKFSLYKLSHQIGSKSDYETFADFVKVKSPIDPKIEGRLLFHNSTVTEITTAKTTLVTNSGMLIKISSFLLSMFISTMII